MKNLLLSLVLLTLTLASSEAVIDKSVTYDSGVTATKHIVGKNWTVKYGYAIESYDSEGEPVYASTESIIQVSVMVCSFVDQAHLDSETECRVEPAFIITDCSTYDGTHSWVESAVDSAL